MDHDHRDVAVAALRHHVAHVHLVDGDVPPGAEVAQLPLRLFNLLAANEEAALRLQHQRLVGRLNVLERLRHDATGHAENAGHGNARHDGQSSRPHESLTSHSQSPFTVEHPHRASRLSWA